VWRISRKEVEQLVYALSSSSEVLRLTRSGDRTDLAGYGQDFALPALDEAPQDLEPFFALFGEEVEWAVSTYETLPRAGAARKLLRRCAGGWTNERS
jgi:hypothetical protein